MTVNKEHVGAFFSPLSDRMNKGDAGRVLCVCGSYNENGLSMCGAAYLAAMAAYRCGAGIVEIFTEKRNYGALASSVPEAVFSLYKNDEDADEICSRLLRSLKKADSVVIGCGLGHSETTYRMLKSVMSNATCPMLIDADGLNIISAHEELWGELDESEKEKAVVTPHIGEMSRLSGKSVSYILENTEEVAHAFAKTRGVVCLIKDNRTVICDKEKVFINNTGNAGMASAGTGDVLSGIIGALLARISKNENADTLSAAALGAYLHGAAGDKAAENTGKYSLMATDVLLQIPEVINKDFGEILQN